VNRHLEPGTLLISVPQMLDPNFMHTVVLVCQHAAEGAFGLVLNCKAGRTVAELLPDHPVLREVEAEVYAGGPVGLDALQFLHRVPDRIRGGTAIADGLYLGGELDELAAFLRDGPEPGRDARLFVGYSGWGAGQLDAELVSGSWVPAPFDRELPFSTAGREGAWRRVLRSLGRAGEGLSQLPPDVSWN
jgi:putative transcriptional regulator